jgi:hypothetical protein
MKKLLIISGLALVSICATAQNFTYALTNFSPQLQAEFESVRLLNNFACTTNVNSKSYLPQYVYATNAVVTVTATNATGRPTAWVTNQVVTTMNSKRSVAQFIDDMGKTHRAKMNMDEIAREFLAAKRAEIGEAKIKASGSE